MTIRVMTAGSVSANYHVHVRAGDIPFSVSAGYANERTMFFRSARDIPVEVQDTRITVLGTFGSGSASTVVAIDIGPNGSAYANLFSVSAPFTTTIPVQVDHVLRFRHAYTSAAEAGALGASVDAWVG